MPAMMIPQKHSKGPTTLEVVGAAVNVLNIIVSVIVAVEVIIRFTSFLKEWKPAQKRKMGFYKKAGE